MTLGTRIVVMKDGVVQQVEAPIQLYNNPANLFVAGFIGSPSMNFFDAYVGEEEGKVVVYLGGSELGKKVYLRGEKAEVARQREMGKKVVLGIRPEDIYDYEEAKERGIHMDTRGLEETVSAREMLGAEVILYFDAQGKTHAVKLSPENQTRTGEKGDSVMNTGKKKKLNWTPYCYLIPCMLVFAIFLFYPFFKTIYLSLFLTDRMGQAKIFVGMQNYIDLLTSESFRQSLKVTLIFVVIVVIGGMLLGLIAAVLCNKAFPGIRAFSTAYALPMAIASTSAAMIFQIMLHPTVGIINKLTGLDINWLNDPDTALICVAILTAWLNSGINFLYFSAGLGNIDETIYERASVDGASSVQQFFSLTLPGLSPIMFYTLVVNIIQAFQSFGQINILTQGGPDGATNVIVYSIYRDAFFNYRFGSAAAQSVILFIIIMLITLVMFRLEKKGVNY